MCPWLLVLVALAQLTDKMDPMYIVPNQTKPEKNLYVHHHATQMVILV